MLCPIYSTKSPPVDGLASGLVTTVRVLTPSPPRRGTTAVLFGTFLILASLAAPRLVLCLLPAVLLYLLSRSRRRLLILHEERPDDMVASETEMATVLAILDEMRIPTPISPLSPLSTPKYLTPMSLTPGSLTPESLTPDSTPAGTMKPGISVALAELHASWGDLNAARAKYPAASEKALAAKRALVRVEARANARTEESLRKAIAVIDETLIVLEAAC